MSRRQAWRLTVAAVILAGGWELAGLLLPQRPWAGPLNTPITSAYGDAVPYVSYGDCRDPRTAPRSPGEYLLVVAGGSTVVVGSPPLVDRLAERFRRAGFRRLRLVNCGVIAQNSSQELARLLFRISDLKPNLLLVYDGGNDIFNPLYTDPRPGYPHNFIAWQSNPILDESVPWWAEFVARSPVLRWALAQRLAPEIFQLERARREAAYGTPVWRQALAQTYVGNLVKMRKVAGAFGIRTVFFLQPDLYDKRPLSPTEAAMAAEKGWRAHNTDVKTRIRRLAAAERGRLGDFADLSGALDGQPETFTDHIHLNQQGDARMADVLYARLRALGIPSASAFLTASDSH